VPSSLIRNSRKESILLFPKADKEEAGKASLTVLLEAFFRRLKKKKKESYSQKYSIPKGPLTLSKK